MYCSAFRRKCRQRGSTPPRWMLTANSLSTLMFPGGCPDLATPHALLQWVPVCNASSFSGSKHVCCAYSPWGSQQAVGVSVGTPTWVYDCEIVRLQSQTPPCQVRIAVLQFVQPHERAMICLQSKVAANQKSPKDVHRHL